MLNAIRVASSKWLGRVVLTIIMGFLIVSFAIWGVGDLFRGNISRNVATIGSTKIGAEAYRQAFNLELRRIQQRARQPITTEQARAFGIDRALLDRLINEAAIDQKNAALGMAVDQAHVMRSITEAPDFKTAGIFDRNRLADALQQSGLSEQAFLQQQAAFLLRQQVYHGLVGAMSPSRSLGRALHQHRDEARDIEAIIIPAEKVAEPAAPDEAALKAFHGERRAEFRTVETRRVTILRAGPGDFAAGLELSEADLRAFYDRGVAEGRFGPPEKRQAERLLFDTEAEAKAAAEKIAAGATFETLMTEKKLGEKDVDLGLKTRAEITDPALAAAIFTLEEGKISPPIKDPFGFVLLRVKKIEAAKVRPFEIVRGLIADEARADRIRRDPDIRSKVDAAFRTIEDLRIAGKSLAEAAEAARLKPLVIETLDREGSDGKGGKPAIPGGAETVTAIFASDIGLDNEPLASRDGGHVWYEINGIEPARDKAFDEVKEEVRARLVADIKAKALAERATALVKKIEDGATLAAVAADMSLPVQTFSGIKRSSRDAVLGQNGVERAFAGPVGKPVSAIAANGGRLVMIPKASTLLPYDADADAGSDIARRLAQAMADDMLAQYVAALRKELGVSINQAQVNQALGVAN